MSFVRPKPDVPDFADQLKGIDRIILSIRPGITGPDALQYPDEAYMLTFWDDPESYIDNFIWPRKVRLNREYVGHWTFWWDLHYF